MGLTLQINQGASRDFPCQIYNPDGTPATQFLNTDTLVTNVWQGSNETPLDNPATAWLNANAPSGQIVISFQNADSPAWRGAVLYPGLRDPRCGPTRTAALLPRGSSLVVLAAAGTTFTARPTYITIQNVRNIAPWIDDLTTPDNDTGFDNQLADARSWLDEMVLRNYRGGNVSLLGMHGFALDAWYTGGGRRTSLDESLAVRGPAAEPAPGDAAGHRHLARITPCRGSARRMITKAGSTSGACPRGSGLRLNRWCAAATVRDRRQRRRVRGSADQLLV